MPSDLQPLLHSFEVSSTLELTLRDLRSHHGRRGYDQLAMPVTR